MKHLAIFFVPVLLIFTVAAASAQQTNSAGAERTVIISGTCWDIATGVDLKAKITAQINGQQKNVGESNDEGKFDVMIPISTNSLTFEAKGYRTITEVVHIDGRVEKGNRFVLSLKMIALGSEQVVKNPAVLKGNQTTQNAESSTTNFEVRDAYLGRPLTAKICMTFPRTSRSYCLDTDSVSAPVVSFVGELENIDIKVTAAGYQDYDGKLKRAPTPSGGIFYQIKLLKKISPMVLFSMTSPDDLNVEYRIGNSSLPFIKGKPWKQIYFERESTGDNSVTARIADNGPVLSEQTYTVKPGLNLIPINVKVPENNLDQITVKASPTPRRDTQQLPMSVKTPPGTFDRTTLYFDQSSYALRPDTKRILDSIAEFLLTQHNLKAQIIGHTDNTGKRELNVMLSEHRARVVAHYLKQKGIHPEKISLKWSGPDTPVAANDAEENKVKNRRVVVELVNDTK
jgi:outer membrane protein OmpA-like peptidoglycan-associated protein